VYNATNSCTEEYFREEYEGKYDLSSGATFVPTAANVALGA